LSPAQDRASVEPRHFAPRAVQLWQMDIVGGFYLSDGSELKAVTGLDDHSRYCVCAHLVLRATSRPTCEALRAAKKTHGVPEAVLTDNGKVFTARFGRGPEPVLFDRICADNGIRHILTALIRPPPRAKWSGSTRLCGPSSLRLTTTALPWCWPPGRQARRL
jgi:transposase InsO family protein